MGGGGGKLGMKEGGSGAGLRRGREDWRLGLDFLEGREGLCGYKSSSSGIPWVLSRYWLFGRLTLLLSFYRRSGGEGAEGASVQKYWIEENGPRRLVFT